MNMLRRRGLIVGLMACGPQDAQSWWFLRLMLGEKIVPRPAERLLTDGAIGDIIARC